jgi:uncharacterized protein (TIGR03435 family)
MQMMFCLHPLCRSVPIAKKCLPVEWIFLAVAAAVCTAQTTRNTLPTFEVESVKSSAVGRAVRCRESFTIDPSRVEFRCATVANLIELAYRLSANSSPPFSPSRSPKPIGADWISGPEKFDIVAKLPAGASATQVPEMLKNLLADRFKLVVHRATMQQELCALVVAKGGPRLKEAAPESEAPETNPNPAPSTTLMLDGLPTLMARTPGGFTISNPRIGTVKYQAERQGRNTINHWDAQSTTLTGLADILGEVGPLPADVKDMTGLEGRFQVKLDISMIGAATAGENHPDAMTNRAEAQAMTMELEAAIFKSINLELQKLGLQLIRRKSSVETLAVDHVEKPSQN